MILFRYFIIILFVNCFCCIYAQNTSISDSIFGISDSYRIETDSTLLSNIDSIISEYEKTQLIQEAVRDYEEKLMDNEMKFNWNSGTSLVKGVVMGLTNRRFRKRDAIFQTHSNNKIDYIPAAIPLATTWILKASGLQSRSKIKRMVFANSLALGIGLGTAEFLKHTVNSKRPDARDFRSMPSGHSTLAFISASILDREYGHYSPWISIGGYSAALATQFSRIHKNAHYLNDVLVGAGIGIVSTNIAYFIADRIWGERQINRPFVSKGDVIQFHKFLNKPTSISFYSSTETGYNLINFEHYNLNTEYVDNIRLRATSSLSAALEYSHFFNSNIAVESLFRITQTKVQALNNSNSIPLIYSNNIYQYHFNVGAKYSYLLGLDKRVAFRTFIGDRFIPKIGFKSIESNNNIVNLENSNDFEIGAGISFDMLTDSKYISGFSFDYVRSFSSIFKRRWVFGSYLKVII